MSHDWEEGPPPDDFDDILWREAYNEWLLENCKCFDEHASCNCTSFQSWKDKQKQNWEEDHLDDDICFI